MVRSARFFIDGRRGIPGRSTIDFDFCALALVCGVGESAQLLLCSV